MRDLLAEAVADGVVAVAGEPDVAGFVHLFFQQFARLVVLVGDLALAAGELFGDGLLAAVGIQRVAELGKQAAVGFQVLDFGELVGVVVAVVALCAAGVGDAGAVADGVDAMGLMSRLQRRPS